MYKPEQCVHKYTCIRYTLGNEKLVTTSCLEVITIILVWHGKKKVLCCMLALKLYFCIPKYSENASRLCILVITIPYTDTYMYNMYSIDRQVTMCSKYTLSVQYFYVHVYVCTYLHLYFDSGDMKKSEEVLYQFILLGQEGTAHLRLAQTNQHREELIAVGVGHASLGGRGFGACLSRWFWRRRLA